MKKKVLAVVLILCFVWERRKREPICRDMEGN